MSIKMVIAVTDNGWLDILRGIKDLDEANFWSPSGTSFKSLVRGELFLFKPQGPGPNKIVGGGVFAHSSVMSWSLAWTSFGIKNGVLHADDLHAKIGKLRRKNKVGNFQIGCRILTQPFFFDEPDWIDVPASWSRNIVRHKTYNTAEPEGMALWQTVQDRLMRIHFPKPEEEEEAESRYGTPGLISPRLGQGAFRARVLDIYNRRCAVTLEKTVPVLEAAHIRPYSDGGKHDIANGLLLRSDLHSLFDEGYVTVNPDLKFEVSRNIKEEFSNGREYYAMQGKDITQPTEIINDPRKIAAFRQALAWHNNNLFKG